MKKILIVIISIFSITVSGQESEELKKAAIQADGFIASGNELLVEQGNFPNAEAEYRKAIAKNPESTTAKYNLANAYYNSQKYDEALRRYKESTKVATSKQAKHKAFHNQGNTFMEQKKYKDAVEAYKNALRNDPTDNETRYNLALAKKMLEEEQQKNDQNQDKDDQNKDQNQDKNENKENQDKKEGENDKDNKDKEGDQEDQGDKGDDEDKDQQGDKDKKEEGDPKDDQQKDQDQGNGDKKEQQMPQQMPGQLSPQQIKNLLEAMNNEEKKVQDKINAEKVKGAKVKTDKDW